MHVNFKFIHRDIKPENVLLNSSSQKATVKKEEVWRQEDFVDRVDVKLCDLGLSKPLEMHGTATQVGTANFICPENYLGHGYDFKADVWALGSVTFEIITGVPLMNFFDPSKQNLDEKFIDGFLYLPKLDRVSLECIDFLASCLQFQPRDRPQMSDVIKHPFLTIPIDEQLDVPDFLFKEYPLGMFHHYSLKEKLSTLSLHKINTKVRSNYLEDSGKIR